MSFSLPSLSAPVSAAQPPASAAARNGDPEKNSPGSFGEVLARAARPSGEAATKPAEKASASSPARGPDDDPETDAEEGAELVNLLGAGFIPTEGRRPPAALPDGAVMATRGDPRLPPAADSLAQPQTGVSLPADGSVALIDAGTDLDAPAAPALVLAAASPKERGQASSLNTRPDASPQDALAAAAPSGTKTPAPPPVQDAAPAGRPSSQAAESPGSETLEASENASETGASRSAPTRNAASQAPEAQLPSVEGLAAATVAGTSTPASGMEASAVMASSVTGAALQGLANPAGPGLPPGVITPVLPQEVGSSEWGKALGQHLVQMGQGGQEVAELQLNPPGLGPLKVTLSMNDHQVQAMFVSAHSSVRAAVEAALPQLRAALADSGISLGDTSVGAESRPQADVNQGQGGQQSGQRGHARADVGVSPTIAERTVIEPRRSGHGITVDTYA
ncbi:flagellar hook-length control protein FliK [Polaromonas sp.]|uniref:flagellar hook-length control protein FliK n=1 Tax=Polaromonas sp. TaxID=1869339 RepID=UPI003266E30E